jgi:hypothetical protein
MLQLVSESAMPKTRILSADERLGRCRDSLWLIDHLVVVRQRRAGRLQHIIFDRHGDTVARCASLEALERWTADAESKRPQAAA